MCLEFSHPSSPLIRGLYDFYSFFIIPLLGKMFVDSQEAYAYLVQSIRNFPPPEELASLMREAGFSQVTFKRLTNGIAAVHLGVKP